MMRRLRILAGPNGSGKTSVYQELCEQFHWGVFVNADEIERHLKDEGYIDCREYAVALLDKDRFLASYKSYFSTVVTQCGIDNILVEDDCIRVINVEKVDSYFAAFVATYIREYLLDSGVSFSFETVLSHPSKLNFMEEAHRKGYRVYLYYVSTQSADINIGRVHTRALEGGHDVPECKIRERYVRSLQNLYQAVKHSDRAYLFDNSGKHFELLAEYNAVNDSIRLHSSKNWLQTYLLNGNISKEVENTDL